jgi:hypothetical protein
VNFSESFHETANRVVSALASVGADWMLIGAIPVAAWGEARATTDADFAASLDLLDAHRLDDALGAQGRQKVRGPVEIPQSRLVLSKYWDARTAIGVDVFFSTRYATGDFQRAALERKKQASFDGRTYPIAAPEDVIVFKIMAFRQKDLDDVAGILERRFTGLDWPYIHRWASALRVDNLLTQIVAEYKKVAGIPGPMPWEGS